MVLRAQGDLIVASSRRNAALGIPMSFGPGPGEPSSASASSDIVALRAFDRVAIGHERARTQYVKETARREATVQAQQREMAVGKR